MLQRKLIAGAIVFALAIGSAVPVVAQQEGEPSAADMEKMMAEYAKFYTPGDHHKHMAKMVGSWDVAGKFWMGPGEPMMSTGTAVFKSMYNGLYITQDYTSEMMGREFVGHGVMAYDIFAEKHASTWIDNLSSGIYKSEGTCAADGKSMTSTGTFDDPMSGVKGKKVKEVVTVISDDSFTFAMFNVMPDGTDEKSMELTYTRKK
ncbi:MAG TPA: DUF1579 domain-containing protein [candidate division Zixibacteria bacterium]|jgi:hypothetical protein